MDSPLNPVDLAGHLGVTREVQGIGVATTVVGRTTDEQEAVDADDGGIGQRSDADAERGKQPESSPDSVVK